MGSSITSPTAITFNGTSTYASSLQQVISKAVSLASLPLQQMQNEKTLTDTKITAAQSLQSVITSLNTSLQSVATSAGNTQTASVSDATVLSATASSNALPGVYTVNVLDPGSSSSSESLDTLPTVSDPTTQSISSSSSYTLTIGSNSYTITPSGSDLDSLAQAINASGASVQATVINIGGNSSPDYKLVLMGTSLGDKPIQLNDGSSDLLTSLTTGSNALYTVNGQPPGGISSDSSTVTIAPGLSVDLLSGGVASVTVSSTPSSLLNALSGFVTAFNNAQAELQKSYGPQAGALSGDSSVFSTSQALRDVVGYAGSGAGTIQSLTDLGIEFTVQGTLTFDSSKVSALSPSQLQDAVAFLGSPTTAGFLASATNTINSVIDSSNGVLTNELSRLNQESTTEGKSIQDEIDKVNQMQDQLITRLNAADALIASLQQQTSFLTQLFNTMNSNNYVGH